jgi:CBS domain containing-hemolysin-like protein
MSAVVVLYIGHRYGVSIGAACAPLVRVLMWACSPVTWPLGKLLDRVLGHEEIAMKRRELKAMVQLHGENAGGLYVSLCLCVGGKECDSCRQ